MALWEYLGAWSSISIWIYRLNWDANDSGGWTNNLTATDITYTAWRLWVNTGSFNGTTSYGTRAPILTYTEIGTAFIFAVWINTTSFSADWRISRHTLNNGTLERNYQVDVVTTWVIRATVFDWAATTLTSTTTMSTWVWYHVIFLYNWSALKIYINWNQKISTTRSWSGYARNTMSRFTLWCEQVTSWWGTSVFYNGKIDEAIVENVSWSPEKIKKYYTYSKWRFWIL